MCDCSARLEGFLLRLGFSKAERGGWERRTKRGTVLVDLKPRHHARAALLALVVRVIS